MSARYVRQAKGCTRHGNLFLRTSPEMPLAVEVGAAVGAAVGMAVSVAVEGDKGIICKEMGERNMRFDL